MKPLKVSELTKKIMNREDIFILDVREKEAVKDWAIEGKNVTLKNIPYKEVKENPQSVKSALPEAKAIYVVCAKGITSHDVVELLHEEGVEKIAHLEGGMTAWSEHLEPIKIADLNDGGTLYQFVRIGKGCLSYMIESNNEVIVIDPVRFTDVFENFVREKGWTIKAVVDTHLHADHISGANELAEKMSVIYYFPPKDDEGVMFDYEPLENGETISVGNTAVQLFYSPGHTVGSTSLIVDDKYLLTGDTLFVESIGRPDLAGKASQWVDDLRETLYSRYKNLSEVLIVLPAHFGSITEMNEGGSIQKKLGEVYQENEQLQMKDRDAFAHMITDNLPPQPNSHEEIRETNLGKKNPDQDKRREMEVGPNRCAIS